MLFYNLYRYTCKTKAGPTQTVINNMGDVRLKSRDYLRKLIEILALSYREKSEDRRWERPVIWSHVRLLSASRSNINYTPKYLMENSLKNVYSSYP